MRQRWVFCRCGLALLALVGLFGLSACAVAVDNEPLAPDLFTLPPGTFVHTATPEPTPTLTETPSPEATTPPPAITLADPVGVEALRELWTWEDISRPASAAVAGDRLAIIMADGRFVWVGTQNGRVESSAVLWNELGLGESSGQIVTDGIMAVAAAVETRLDEESGATSTRTRLVAFNAEAEEMWALPLLDNRQSYHVALTPFSVVIGTGPYGFDDDQLVAYDRLRGDPLWDAAVSGRQINEEGELIDAGPVGFSRLIHDGSRLFALINDPIGAGAAAFDLRNGERLWHFTLEGLTLPGNLVLGDQSLYVLTQQRVLAIDTLDGSIRWESALLGASEAGLAWDQGRLYMALQPGEAQGFRPGMVSLESENGQTVWSELDGFLVDPLAVGREVIWTLARDFDAGEVYLIGLDLRDGGERVRLLIDGEPDGSYQLLSVGQRVYILGEDLSAYGY
ncbi:MAG: PQQ-binding-like beta-propeller repeat protein [Chloroflexi bacterium]|nr:PQQ-binding-like beta-propeller repeat protein [Chloroflexota bacterium]